MDLYKLLSLLADGQFHSGSALGGHLGVSRTAVWKAIPLLEQLGVLVEVNKGKGYRINSGLDLLDINKIKSEFGSELQALTHINILLSCPSTNDVLLNGKTTFKNDSYLVCFTEHQTSGRGRRGRSWISPLAKNLLFSVAFHLQGGAEVLAGLSLVVGIAVGKALNKLGVANVKIKWPNDVYVDDKKIAGILLELSGEATTSWKVVCGVGVNVSMQQQEGIEIGQDWCALDEKISLSRSKVAGAILSELLVHFEDFKSNGFSCFNEDWKRYDWLFYKQVVVTPSGLKGEAVGINQQGALLVRTESGIEQINAGEVSVRCL